MKVWTVRLEGQRTPFLWVTHEGRASEDTVRRVIDQCVAAGDTVIVGLVHHRPRVETQQEVSSE